MTKRFAAVLGLVVLAMVMVAASAQAGTNRRSPTSPSPVGLPDRRGRARLADGERVQQTVGRKRHPRHLAGHQRRLHPAMTARFAAHNTPDVFYVDSSVVGSWIQQGVIQPLNGMIKSTHFNTKPFYPKLLGAFKKGKHHLRLPEGLVAARDRDQQRPVRQGRHEGADELGAAQARREDDGQQGHQRTRSASRPTGRGWVPSCIRTSGSITKHLTSRQRQCRELLRRPDQERPRLHAAGRQLVRQELGKKQRRDHLRRQLAASVHEVDLSEHALLRASDGQGQDAGQPRLHRLVVDREERPEQGGCVEGAQLARRQAGREDLDVEGSRASRRARTCRRSADASRSSRGSVRPRLGLRQPELLQRLHGDGERPERGHLRQQDDTADALRRRQGPQGPVSR